MAIEKIKYKNKVAIKNDESLPEINKVTDENMNEIKKVINNNADELSLIKDQIPTGQASGNPIYINDSSNLEASIRLNGGSKQETRSNNLYNPETNVAGFLNQVGEVVSNTSWVITDYIPVVELLDYYIAGNKNLTPGDNVYGAYYNADKELISTFPYSTYKTETATITTPENCAYIKFSIYKYQDNTKTFDFYTDAPTPNYQSKIETVGSNINLFDKDNANTISGAYVDSSGNIGNGGANSQTLYIAITGGKTYTVSKKATSYGTFRIGTTAEVPALNVQGIDVVSKNGTDTSATITTSSNAKYLTIFCIRTDFDNMQEILESLKIEEGNKTTPYSPYGMGSVEIDVGNKNLFDKNNMNIIDGSFINSATRKIESNANRKCFYIKINPNEHYTISREKIASTFIVGTTREIPVIGSDILDIDFNNNEITTILSSANAYYLVCYYKTKSTEVESDIVNNIQIEVGEQATEYVEHQSQNKIMPIQQELLEGDYIEDVEHHGWGKVILDGENIKFVSKSGTSNNMFVTQPISKFKKPVTNSEKINMLSNYFKAESTNNIYANSITGINIRVDKQICVGFGLDSTINTIELANEWLKEHNVIAYAPLETPLDLELTEEQKEAQKINTYNNVTNIAVDNSLATLDVTYKKDQNTVNKNYENRIAALEAAILS